MTQPIQPWMQKAAHVITNAISCCDVILDIRGEDEAIAAIIAAHAPAEQTQRIAELEAGLTQCADALACCYNVLQSPADGTSIQDAALAKARALLRKEGSET